MPKLSPVTDEELGAFRERAADLSAEAHDLARRMEHGDFRTAPPHAAATAQALNGAAISLLEVMRQIHFRLALAEREAELRGQLKDTDHG